MSQALRPFTWAERADIWARLAESQEQAGDTRGARFSRANEATCTHMASREGTR